MNLSYTVSLSIDLTNNGVSLQIVDQRGPMVPIVVVGNKSELAERVVAQEIAETTAVYDWECGYVECSAKDNHNIVKVFKELLVQAKVRHHDSRRTVLNVCMVLRCTFPKSCCL